MWRVQVSHLQDVGVAISTLFPDGRLYVIVLRHLSGWGPETQTFYEIVHGVVIDELRQVIEEVLTNIFRLYT